jgi:hypothetical protein
MGRGSLTRQPSSRCLARSRERGIPVPALCSPCATLVRPTGRYMTELTPHDDPSQGIVTTSGVRSRCCSPACDGSRTTPTRLRPRLREAKAGTGRGVSGASHPPYLRGRCLSPSSDVAHANAHTGFQANSAAYAGVRSCVGRGGSAEAWLSPRRTSERPHGARDGPRSTAGTE